MSENTSTVVEAEDAPTRRDERGMTTAEYAVGTVAAVGLGGVLIRILTSEEIREMFLRILLWVLELVMGQNPFG